MHRKTTAIMMMLVALMLVLAGCGTDEGDEAAEGEGMETYEDGVYFAEDEFSESSGWKNVVVLEVSDGEIARVRWDGAHRQNGTPKYMRSERGNYGMVENGGAMAPWFEQVDEVTDWLIENQDIGELELNDEGRPDAISGASINVAGFKSLVQEALDEGPVGYGMYEDGDWHATQSEFGDNGWQDVVNITVIGGRIVAVEWDSVNEDGDLKADLSQEGEYGMVEQGDAMAPWHEQAQAAEQWLMENQDPSELELNDEGRADAISGASIRVGDFKQLAMQALEGHER